MNKKKIIIIIIATILGLCVLCGVFSTIYGNTPAGKSSLATNAVEKIKTANVPTSTTIPTLVPTMTLAPVDALKDNIVLTLGAGNRKAIRLTDFLIDDQKGVFVEFSINDNLTNDYIKFGAKSDVLNILKAVHNSGIDYSNVGIVGTFSMQDAYGNLSEEKVVKLVYSKSTINKINWDNFLVDNVYKIADVNLTIADFR